MKQFLSRQYLITILIGLFGCVAQMAYTLIVDVVLQNKVPGGIETVHHTNFSRVVFVMVITYLCSLAVGLTLRSRTAYRLGYGIPFAVCIAFWAIVWIKSGKGSDSDRWIESVVVFGFFCLFGWQWRKFWKAFILSETQGSIRREGP